jgi:hypothetical protein
MAATGCFNVAVPSRYSGWFIMYLAFSWLFMCEAVAYGMSDGVHLASTQRHTLSCFIVSIIR